MSISSRFAARPQYPLSKKLLSVFGTSTDRNIKKARNRFGDKFGRDERNDIVSESLCDDVIKYLAPTLEQHKGCTIIDIHPGACLWSSKLHDFLKPKRHLLMEPEEKYFKPFIKPLLNKPESTYRHTHLSGAHPNNYWENYRDVLTKPELAPRDLLPDGDPRLRQLDPSFLVVGNLARIYKVLRRVNSVAFGSMMLQQASRVALSNDLYHSGGLVRMLWWVPESEKFTIYPTTELHKRYINTHLSFTTSTTEVAGCASLYEHENVSYARRRRRPEILEAHTASQADQSMQQMGMERPESRSFLYKWPKKDTQKVVSPLISHVKSVEDLERDIEAVRNRVSEIMQLESKIRNKRKTVTAMERDALGSMQFPQCEEAAAPFAIRWARTGLLALMCDLMLQVIRLEVGYKIIEGSGADSEKLELLHTQIIGLDKRVMDFSGQRDMRNREWLSQIIDEQLCIFADPPMLGLEARKYESLKAVSTEFWPENELMLLDMVPQSRDLTVPDLANQTEGARIFAMLARGIMESTRITLAAALDRIAPNAAQDLLPAVPAATDPRKGGRLNPFEIRCRMVSEDILEGLVKAWVEWPFKPLTMELELAAESDAPVEATEDDEDDENTSFRDEDENDQSSAIPIPKRRTNTNPKWREALKAK